MYLRGLEARRGPLDEVFCFQCVTRNLRVYLFVAGMLQPGLQGRFCGSDIARAYSQPWSQLLSAPRLQGAESANVESLAETRVTATFPDWHELPNSR